MPMSVRFREGAIVFYLSVDEFSEFIVSTSKIEGPDISIVVVALHIEFARVAHYRLVRKSATWNSLDRTD